MHTLSNVIGIFFAEIARQVCFRILTPVVGVVLGSKVFLYVSEFMPGRQGSLSLHSTVLYATF